LPELGSPVHAVTFSADGRTVTAAGKDGAGRVWEAATGKELHNFAVTRQHTRWDADYAEMLSVSHSSYHPLALSADGTALARLSAPDGILLWNVASGKDHRPVVDCALAVGPVLNPSWLTGCLAFSPSGKELATYCADGRARLWDTATRKELRRFEGHEDPVARLLFSPDGKTLISLGAGPAGLRRRAHATQTLHRWDVATGQKLPGFPVPASTAFALSPDGKALVVAADDPDTPFILRSSPILLLDLATGKEVRRFRGPEGHLVISLAFSPDGKTLASAGQGTPICLWDVTTGKGLGRLSEPKWEGIAHKGNCCHVTFAEDGKALFSVRGPHDNGRPWTVRQVSEWCLPAGVKRRHSQDLPQDWAFHAFSPDGKAAAFVDAAQVVHVWDLAAGKERCRSPEPQNWIVKIAFSPDGKALAAANLDTTILLWDLPPARKGRAQRQPVNDN
jgi:WD40 repeat protein